MDQLHELRAQLSRFLDWRDAHVGFDRAVQDVPEQLRGATPDGLVHTPWQLLEHLRLTQRDILDFCRDPGYTEPRWPDDYWPPTPAPPSPAAWEQSIAAVRADRAALQRLATDEKVDLFAKIPHGSGQTYLRELLLVADHGAYHVGQLVDVRRALGDWEEG
ncbi:MAG TPA: DinB family protein [Gemmatimonadaceae bacterium]|nr:DinB family protein [Gemmatimonadaceae bacterium]